MNSFLKKTLLFSLAACPILIAAIFFVVGYSNNLHRNTVTEKTKMNTVTYVGLDESGIPAMEEDEVQSINKVKPENDVVPEDEMISGDETVSGNSIVSGNAAVSENEIKSESENAVEEMETITICIDPGHYKGASRLVGANLYGYDEGDATLKIAKMLKTELESYGIDAFLTRDTDDITIDGYTNRDLDSEHISLRGKAAKDADLFISIHTNANGSGANGYPTCEQPVEINKSLVIVNQYAADSDKYLNVANEIGIALTKTNYERGLVFSEQFVSGVRGIITEWTEGYNDSLSTCGSVCMRKGPDGDYYGVLRGASEMEVPGMIIEHGFHTIEKIRKEAMQGDLLKAWAKADAYGIAKGLGLRE